MFARKVSQGLISRRKKLMVAGIAATITVLLGSVIIGYVSIAHKLHTILPGSPIDALTKSEPLQATNGRTNFLIFGTSYDDPNPSHSGGYLTDSLIVLSVDEHAKTAYTISIPRDLWVDYDTSCSLGKSGKINAAYICALDAYGSSATDKASRALTDKISAVVGLPIQYYVEANYTLIHSLTDALGGIDVDIYSEDPRGIDDPTVGLKLPAGVSHLDGKTALKLARARNSHGGYGLPRSNFDREINQQRIIAAMLKKASVDGTLDNMNSALKLINALSGQVHTNVQTSQLRSAVDAARSLKTSNVISIPLTDYMTTGTLNGQSIVRPVTGLNDYTALQKYVATKVGTGDVQ